MDLRLARLPVSSAVVLGQIDTLSAIGSCCRPVLPPWISDPAGPTASEIVPLYWFMFGAAVLVLAIVDGALIWSGIKYRERPGVVAKQFHGNNFLELAWT